MSDADAGPAEGDAVTVFLWRHRLLICILAVIGAISGVVASRYMDRWYRADVLVSPTATDSGLGTSQMLGQFGSLASLAGINLGQQGTTSALAIATLKTHAFLGDFVSRHKLLPVLFSSRWNSAAQAWRLKGTERTPSVEDGVDYLLKSVLHVLEDRDKNLYTVRVEWKDPALAAEWANALVTELNAVMRQRAIDSADASLNYLERELDRSASVELRQSIAANIQAQVTKRMLAITRPDFSFTVLDPALAPDPKDRVRPVTALLAAIGLFAGAIVAVFAAMLIASRSKPAD